MSSDNHRIGGDLESPWFLTRSPNPHARLRLFCLPHAGGDTWIFRDWQRALPSFVEVCAIRLPGRGSRRAAPPVVDFDDLVCTLETVLGETLDMPFAIFGNSMGALIAFEVARRIRQTRQIEPRILCVAAARAPQLAYFPAISMLPPRQIMGEIQRRYGGSMDNIAQSDQLIELTMPLMQADLELCETYRYREGLPLDCMITAYAGRRDATLDADSVDAWAVQTTGAFTRHDLDGDHFFAVASKSALLPLLAKDLEGALS